MDSRVHFSSASDRWATPKAIHDGLDAEFQFDFDPCPLDSAFDGLAVPWVGKRVFCNPPYGPAVGAWLKRGTEADLAVFLIPARTDTRWFHDIVLPLAHEIRFLRGRLRFNDDPDPLKRAPFPSMVVVFHK